uniref:Uncharacterized protein n=1 Tax=Lepeophtheirus salmonis TaxID=72036 RepID=A0A0K2TFU1_LEPSM
MQLFKHRNTRQLRVIVVYGIIFINVNRCSTIFFCFSYLQGFRMKIKCNSSFI